MSASRGEAGAALHQEATGRAEEQGTLHLPEERNRHLRYADEQYSGSAQGRVGAPESRDLPLQKPPAEKQRTCPPGTKMPWPPHQAIEAETKPPGRRTK